jgi:hypothetical protein
MADHTSVSIVAFFAGPEPQQHVVSIYLNKASLATREERKLNEGGGEERELTDFQDRLLLHFD